MTASAKVAAGARSLSATIAHGLVAMAHNSFALIGLLVAFCALTLFSRADLRHAGEEYLRTWLQARQGTQVEMASDDAAADDNIIAAVDRATATTRSSCPRTRPLWRTG